jgi:hypothetical protein
MDMAFCTLPGCTNQFVPKKGRRFCCPAHRARSAYLPKKKEAQARKLEKFRTRRVQCRTAPAQLHTSPSLN